MTYVVEVSNGNGVFRKRSFSSNAKAEKYVGIMMNTRIGCGMNYEIKVV